jgi:hypothetical protein
VFACCSSHALSLTRSATHGLCSFLPVSGCCWQAQASTGSPPSRFVRPCDGGELRSVLTRKRVLFLYTYIVSPTRLCPCPWLPACELLCSKKGRLHTNCATKCASSVDVSAADVSACARGAGPCLSTPSCASMCLPLCSCVSGCAAGQEGVSCVECDLPPSIDRAWLCAGVLS